MTSGIFEPSDHQPLWTSTDLGADGRRLIAEIFDAITQFKPLSTTLETIASRVCTHLGFHFCAILLQRPDTDLLVIEGSAGLAQTYVEAVNRRFPIHIEDPLLNEGPSSQAFRTGEAVIVEDTETDERFRRWRALARQQGIRSLLSVPLLARGRVTGTLNGYQGRPRRYRDDEVRTLKTVATQAGIAIEIARMVETQTQTIQRLGELTRELDEQRRLLERSAEIHDALTQLVLTNRGIPAIARTLARVVGYPVVVQDQFLQVLSAARPSGEPGTDLPPLTAEMVNRRGLRPGSTDVRAPFELPARTAPDPSPARAVAPIVAGRDLLGYVSVILDDSPATPLTLRAVAHAATVLALEIVKDRLAHEVELRARHGFVADLLAGRLDDPELTRNRGRHLGYDLNGPFQAIVFEVDPFEERPDGFRLPEPGLEERRQRFTAILQCIADADRARTLLAERHGRMVMVLTAVDGTRADMAERALSAVRGLVAARQPGVSFSAGVGRVVGSLDRIPASYREAEQSLSVIRRFSGRATTLSYSDLGVARLLYQVDDPAELIAFARERLQPILDYDRQRDGILRQALESYLAAGQSIPLAAERLRLHPNTLRYRLRKAESLLGATLSDVNLLLDVQLACMILRLIDPSVERRDAVCG